MWSGCPEELGLLGMADPKENGVGRGRKGAPEGQRGGSWQSLMKEGQEKGGASPESRGRSPGPAHPPPAGHTPLSFWDNSGVKFIGLLGLHCQSESR